MPITLSLAGRAAPSAARLTRAETRDWLDKAAVWFEGIGDVVSDARVVRDGGENPVLLVALHPAARPAEIRLGAGGRVRVVARTTPAGPGYHIHLCHLLRQFAADFDLTWDDAPAADPTGYFHAGDRAACEAYFLWWLGERCAARLDRDPAAAVCLGLPAGHGFTAPGPVLTPLGPRPRDWLAAVAAAPPSGRDFFPWLTAEPDAAFYRSRALVRLWCDFPWRPPLTEAEGELTDQIANDLATAYKLDPAGELPWREWLEVLTAIEGDDAGHTVTPADPELREAVLQRLFEADPSAPPVGYRRAPVRVGLCGGWSVEVPGGFAREWDDDRTWTGWNHTRTVWVHVLGFTKADGSRPTPAEAVAVGRRSLPDGDAVPGIDGGGVRGEAVYGRTEEDGRVVWRLSGVSAADGQLAVCHVYTEDPADRPWAVAAWHSLRHGR